LFYPEEIINKVKNKLKIKISIIGLINCGRVVEIRDFKKSNNWDFEIEADIKRQFRKSIGCSYDNNLCLLNYNGQLLCELNSLDNDSECVSTIVKLLNTEKEKK
jgi:hypothetical protein